MVSIASLIPKLKSSFEPVTDFVRTNPLVAGAGLGVGATTIFATATTFIKRRKKKKKTTTRKRRKTTKRKTKRAKSRRSKRTTRARKKKRKIIRGRGLGTREIRHSGRGTKGKFKLVKFRDKRTGKMVSFKAKR